MSNMTTMITSNQSSKSKPPGRGNQKRTMKRNRQSVVPQWKPERQVMTALEQDDKGFYKSEGTIELHIDRFAEFVRDGKRQYSEPVYVRGLAWKIYACSRDTDNDSDSGDTSQSDDDSGQLPSKKLSVYLFCNKGSTSQTWVCEATYTLRVMAQKECARNIIRRNLNRIFGVKNGFGFSNFANCNRYRQRSVIFFFDKISMGFCAYNPRNEVHVQKSILSLHSEFFNDQFAKHKGENRAILEDVNYDDFVLLLSIIYRTGCSITAENVEIILKLAMEFNMAGLLRECEDYFMKHTTNVGRAKSLLIAESYGLVYLQGKIIDEIKSIADIRYMKPELDTLSNRTKRMLLDKICPSGPAFNPAPGPHNIGMTTSRATEILEELASSVCSATDGFLIVENNRIPIHKAYLAMCSNYFTAMFQGEFTERNKDEVVLENFGYGEILELLAVIYPTDSTITDQNIEVILKTAEYFSMPRILTQCKNHLQNSKEISAARKLWLAQCYHIHDLQAEYAKKYRKISEVEKLRAEPEYSLLDDKTRALILDSITS